MLESEVEQRSKTTSNAMIAGPLASLARSPYDKDLETVSRPLSPHEHDQELTPHKASRHCGVRVGAGQGQNLESSVESAMGIAFPGFRTLKHNMVFSARSAQGIAQ